MVELGRSLTTTSNGHFAPDVDALPKSTVRFAVVDPFMPMPGVTFLPGEHSGLPETDPAAHLEIGWITILSGLTTLLETSAPLSGPQVSRRASRPAAPAERPPLCAVAGRGPSGPRGG